jgi:uncharacterized protein involved in outer membrane biogenesis
MRKGVVLKVVGVGVGLVLVLVIAAVAYVSINLDNHKGAIVDAVRDATGRDIEIGELSLVPALAPTVGISDVRFANADWGTEADMVTAKRIEARIALIPLLSSTVVVEKFALVEPDIFIETDAEGRGNWAIGGEAVEQPEQPGEPEGQGAPALGVHEVLIEKGRFRFLDGSTGQTLKLVVDELSVQAEDKDSPLEIKVAAEYNDTPISIEATLGALHALLGNESFPVDLSVDAAGALVTVNGAIDRPMDATGLGLDIALKAESLDALSGLAGTDLPPLGPVALSGRVSDSEATYRVEGLTAKIGGSDVSGQLAVTIAGERPRVSAELASTNLDLADLTGESQPAASTAKQSGGGVFPKDPLPFDALRALDADIAFKADRVATPQMSAEQVDLGLKLDNGLLTVKPGAARVAGGAVDTDLVVDARSDTASLTVNLKANQIELGRLLQEAAGNDMVSGGRTDVAVDLTAQGNSVQTIAAGLNGKLLVVSGAGRIGNNLINLAGGSLANQALGALNPLAEKSDSTAMECAVLRFDIQNGVATSANGIAFETDKMAILGTGTINLGNEALNLLIESTAKEGVVGTAVSTVTLGKGVSLAGLVQVGGTLSAPAVQLNPEGLLKEGASMTAAIATGGLSELAKGLLNETAGQQSPCLIAQGKAVPTTTTGTQATESITSTGAKAAGEVTTGVKEAGQKTQDKVRGLLKGVLGD